MERLTDRELEIMQAIWNSECPRVQTSEILCVLKQTKKQSLQPLQVTLKRLCNKKVLCCEKVGHFNYYRASLEQEEYRKFETEDVMNRLYKSSAKNLIFSLADDSNLSNSDLEELVVKFSKDS